MAGARQVNFRYPIFLDLRGKRCLVAGEGYEIPMKVEALVDAQADVIYFNETAEPRINAFAEDGRLTWRRRTLCEDDLDGAFLVITDQPDNSKLFHMCEQRSILCNSVDDPEHCRFSFGSVHRQGDLTIAISTNGWAPAVAVRLKEKFRNEIGPEFGTLLALLKQVRPEITARIADFSKRRELWYRIVDSAALAIIKAGRQADAERLIRSYIDEAIANQ